MSDATFPAACDSCGHEYQVPDPAKTYSCRQCDGQVVAAAEAVMAEEEALLCCAGCGGAMDPSDRFCGDCGTEQDGVAAALGAEPSPAPPRRIARTGRSGKQRSSRAKASKELTKALGVLKTLRTFFRIGLFFAVVGIIANLIALSDNQFALGFLIIGLMIRVASGCMMLMGARLIFFQPFLWSLIYACMVTLNSAVFIFSIDFHLVGSALAGAWALLFWFFVPQAARAQRLMEENPDLAAVRQMTGVLRRGDATEEDYAEANAVAAQRARKKAFTWSGGLAGATAAIAALVVVQYHRPSFDSVWSDFQEDWDAGRLENVVAYFPDGQQPGQRDRLKAIVANRNWSGSWPQPEDPELLYSESETISYKRQVVEAGFGDDNITLTWQASGKEWHLHDIDLPEPAFEAIEEQWVTLWEADDVLGLGRMFEDPVSATKDLQALMERREWKTLPSVNGAEVRGGGEFREIRLDTTLGVFMVRFSLVSDLWKATSLKAPRS